ncbi:endoplasmic reticulum metallopeptidase 1 isoform X3 [Esox lucius]|uniref:endoplasmic reticulum metallopeptidase 1 isoform X3 n=1 Tax=Esox lucius TaxID=8010 RepID=UPI0009732B20|nr:endoplasmic reticulum metallopeptidase 1 isoform X3 [Esox lucius]
MLSGQGTVVGVTGNNVQPFCIRKHLENITSIGPRPLGSQENEVVTVNYLLEQIEHIKVYSALGPHSVIVDIQKPTGYVFWNHYYDRISNIAVRLEPKDGTQHLMLANCHFDTVANSPGASDNAVGCAVMLEVLHSLANLSTPLKHGVVFVFNGAEENMLQGSHGFITQHPWANQIRAFINLDSAGVGGKEMMFQAGPNSPWLVQAYVHAAKHPFASVVAQEIFQSGMIPSDTDFRIYSHFGKIPGIDLAFIENGFIYHTKYDTPDRILTDSIQRAGDNILAILKHLMMSKELGNFSEAHPGQMVFFDLLGMVMVAYPARIGTIINYVTAVATFLYLFIKCCYTGNIETHLDSAETTLANAETIHASAEPSQTSCVDQGDCVDGETTLTGAETLDDAEIIQASPDPPPTLWNGLVNCSRRACCYLVKLVLATLLLIISWIITGLTVYIIALVVSLMGRSMFWYSNLYAGIFLYGSAATGMMVLIHTVAKNLYYRSFCRPVCRYAYQSACQPVFQQFVRRKLGELNFDVSLLVWCFALIFLTANKMCSAYIPMLMVAFPLVTKLLLTREFRLRGLSLKYMVLYLLGLSPPYVYFVYLMWLVFEVFIPIQGRNTTHSPEVFLAVLISLSVIFLSSFFIHFIYLVRSTKGLLASLGTVFTVFLLLVFCGLFFPYTADPSAPRPKRVFIQHITSTIHDLDGQVESKDSGLLINSEDFTDMQHITPLIPEINNTVRRESCHVRPFCFWPWFVSVRNNWYIPAAEVFPKSPVEFQLLSKENTKWGTVKMTFEVKGPSHMSFYFETHRGAFLASWSFANEMHPFYENRHLSISYSHGIDAPVWNFSIEIQPPRKDDPSGPEEMVSVAFNSYYYFGEDQRTVQLDNMLERFPKWAFVSSWASIYQMYRY